MKTSAIVRLIMLAILLLSILGMWWYQSLCIPVAQNSAAEVTSQARITAPTQPTRIISISNIADLQLTTEDGTVYLPERLWRGTIPGIRSAQHANQRNQLFIAADQSYTITFRGRGQQSELSIIFSASEEPHPGMVILYHRLEIPEAVPAIIQISAYETANLRLDTDHDGEYETMIEPSTILGEN